TASFRESGDHASDAIVYASCSRPSLVTAVPLAASPTRPTTTLYLSTCASSRPSGEVTLVGGGPPRPCRPPRPAASSFAAPAARAQRWSASVHRQRGDPNSIASGSCRYVSVANGSVVAV